MSFLNVETVIPNGGVSASTRRCTQQCEAKRKQSVPMRCASIDWMSAAPVLGMSQFSQTDKADCIPALR